MQGKAGLLIAGLCGAMVLTGVGYGMGRRAALKSIGSSVGVTPAGAPLPTIQIEPIQPQEELAAISAAPASAATPATVGALSASPTETASALPADESTRVREIQLALRAAGFDPGSTDGRLGPRTRSAVRDFQQANGLEADGKIGPRTWAKLESFLKKSNSGSTSD